MAWPYDGPTLHQNKPLYPQPLQLIRVTAAVVAGPAGVAQVAGSSFLGPTLYVAFVEQLRTDSLLPRDREPCLADDVNGRGLTPGFYLGRLAGSFNSLPVYEVISAVATGGGGGTTNFIDVTVLVSNSIFNITNGSIFNFGNTTNTGVAPPGIFSKPTQTVTGAPTWVPPSSAYALLWGAYDHFEWEYDNLLPTGGGTSSIPGRTGWRPFADIGRTPVADANYTAIPVERLIAYTSITAPRVVTLPKANSVPYGFILRIQDESGDADSTNTVSVRRSGADNVNRQSDDVIVVNSSFGGGTAQSNGVSEWIVKRQSFDFSGCSLQLDPPITIASGGTPIVDWTFANIDTDNYFNLAGAPSRITIPFDGYYDGGVHAVFQASTLVPALCSVQILINGTVTFVFASAISNRSANTIGLFSCLMPTRFFFAGDYLQVKVFHTEVVNVDFSTVTASTLSKFWVELAGQ